MGILKEPPLKATGMVPEMQMLGPSVEACRDGCWFKRSLISRTMRSLNGFCS